MSATVKIKAAADARIRLPLSALMNDAAGSAVWRVDAKTQTVQRVPVRVGAIDGNAVWIEQGVNPGEVVVTAGAHLLHEGQAVRALSASVSP
jgi:multidrug efflux pump subunit AcrA (membrane-fusion protein)